MELGISGLHEAVMVAHVAAVSLKGRHYGVVAMAAGEQGRTEEGRGPVGAHAALGLRRARGAGLGAPAGRLAHRPRPLLLCRFILVPLSMVHTLVLHACRQ